jgi:flagellar basal-body rod protein FlgF
MDTFMSAAASGARARLEALDLLANNIANAGTTGYRADSEFYNLYRADDVGAGADGTALPQFDHQWTDFSSGSLQSTGNPLDFAISGKGFFTAQGPDGPVYTRNGSFEISRAGELQTKEGYKLISESGRPVKLDPARPFTVDPDGTVHQDGARIDRLVISEVQDETGLEKLGSTYFRMADIKGIVRRAESVRIEQGRLESSNVAPAEAAVRLVKVMRQFETLQRAIGTGSEMNRKAVDEVAKVSA